MGLGTIIVIVILIIIVVARVRRGESLVNSTRVVTFHYTNWCPYCKTAKPVWERVKAATRGSNIVFRERDEDKVKTSNIRGYPTIRMIDEYGHARDYNGPMDFDKLRAWVVSPRTW